MYNGLSPVYCIKPEGIIHEYTKGKKINAYYEFTQYKLTKWEDGSRWGTYFYEKNIQASLICLFTLFLHAYIAFTVQAY